MLLKGMRVDSRINSLDDIFNHDDLGLLADVKPVTAKTDENAMVLQTFKKKSNRFSDDMDVYRTMMAIWMKKF